MEKENKSDLSWHPPEPRASLLKALQGLQMHERLKRLRIPRAQQGYVEDEVVAMLTRRSARGSPEENSYASVLLARVASHVKGHVHKHSMWQNFGGKEAATADFIQDVTLKIINDPKVPCHAEVAFGQYVNRRCKDYAGRQNAKKFSASVSLDDEAVTIAAEAQQEAAADTPTHLLPPDEYLAQLQERAEREDKLERIRQIVQELPDLPQRAFTFRFYGGRKIYSKKKEEVTVANLMGVGETAATKYINQAIEIIKQKLEK
jgi:DNA-directed RNA polymerase specialized sigma24 family protein